MNNIIKIAYFQQDIIWEDTIGNIRKIDIAINALKPGTDLFILPEMFHAGFTMNPEKVAEGMDGKVVKWMKDNAIKHDLTIIGSVIIHEYGNYFNRLFVVNPDSSFEFYDKRHLFSIGGEAEIYKEGEKKLITEVKGYRIFPLICYDLRFPVWSRCRNNYDLLIYIANWPETRREVWKTLLKARALENQCYVIGVNRVGTDNLNSYAGDSLVVDARGEVISSAIERKEEVVSVKLDLSKLTEFRNKFPVWKDADDFNIQGIL